jgi:hypothetical protein
MTPEDDDRIRALLRELHRDDARSSPFRNFLGKRDEEPRRAVRSLALVGIVAAGSLLALLWPRRSSPPPAGEAFAWSSADWQGPLDFLLQLPDPRPLDALPGLESPKGREQ